MLKKFALGFAAVALAVATVPMFAAFEAHVINVTARIENALTVDTTALNFGTVFPQEHLAKPMTVALSQSFQDEGRVDDVQYFIRQKPKCGVTTENGTILLGPTATGHIEPNLQTTDPNDYIINCGTDPRKQDDAGNFLPTGSSWGVLPSLCEYISKDGSDEDGQVTQNDQSLPSFHTPWTFANNSVTWTDTRGNLTKDGGDTIDKWIIDLAVPCFGGYCAQDWADFVHGLNREADPNAYTQPIANEHKVFGCDLWVEVDGVSLTADLE